MRGTMVAPVQCGTSTPTAARYEGMKESAPMRVWRCRTPGRGRCAGAVQRAPVRGVAFVAALLHVRAAAYVPLRPTATGRSASERPAAAVKRLALNAFCAAPFAHTGSVHAIAIATVAIAAGARALMARVHASAIVTVAIA